MGKIFFLRFATEEIGDLSRGFEVQLRDFAQSLGAVFRDDSMRGFFDGGRSAEWQGVPSELDTACGAT